MNRLTALVYGSPGSGKSWLGQTTPTPRLTIDAEGGSRVPWRWINGEGVRQKSIEWDPLNENPPEPNGWETCHVDVIGWKTIQHTYDWLNSGRHPFRSVTLDSVTMAQKRCKYDISADEMMRTQDWGALLIQVENKIRFFTDLVRHPFNPLDAIVFLAQQADYNGKAKPFIEGSLRGSLAGYVDLEGFLYVEPTEEEPDRRRLLIKPQPLYEAKDRTHVLSRHYGPIIDNPDIEEMLAVYNQEEQ